MCVGGQQASSVFFSVFNSRDIFKMDVPPVIESLFEELDPSVRKRKISNVEVLRLTCYSLKTGVPWRYIPTLGKCDWSTAYKRYQRWVNNGLFDKALTKMHNLYSDKMLSLDPKWFKELFIDCSFVKNVGGVDGLGKNPTDRGRLATKISAIVDNNRMPLSCVFYPGNTSDCTTAIETVDKLGCKVRINQRYKPTIIGDKGYISHTNEEALHKRRMNLITPVKKNAKNAKKLTTVQKDALRRRHKVENFFCRLDKFKKIHCRHEKSLKSYKALTSLAMALMFANHTIFNSVFTP